VLKDVVGKGPPHKVILTYEGTSTRLTCHSKECSSATLLLTVRKSVVVRMRKYQTFLRRHPAISICYVLGNDSPSLDPPPW